MPDGTIPPPSGGMDAPARPGTLMSWYQNHKGVTIGGGIFIIALVGYLIYRHDQNVNAANAAAASNTANTSTAAGTTATTPGTYDTTGYGYYPYSGGYGGTLDMSTLASILNSVESQIAANSATSSSDNDTTTSGGTTQYPNAGKGKSVIPGTNYVIEGADTPGGVDILQNNKLVGSYFIPKTGYLPIVGGLEIGEASDKAVGAVDVYQQKGNKFVGSFVT